MSHRTQITLEDEQYARLQVESSRTGLGLAELIRRAVDTTYRPVSVDEAGHRLEVSFAAWAEVEIDGEAYVEGLRPGLGRRLDTA